MVLVSNPSLVIFLFSLGPSGTDTALNQVSASHKEGNSGVFGPGTFKWVSNALPVVAR